MRGSFILAFFFMGLLISILSGATNNVPGDFPTIQEGIDACLEGDTVLVQPGIYTGNLLINYTNIVLTSTFITAGDSVSILNTILDGEYNGSVINIAGTLDSSTVICGFTIQHGQSLAGGGLYLDSASITICHNIIRNNRAISDGENLAYGGGIFCLNCSPRIINNTITYNTSEYYPYRDGYGAGICCYNSDAIIEGNLITQNSASGITSGGAGIYCLGSAPSVRYNTIKLNTGNWGSGVFFDSNCDGIIYRNAIYANYGGGILCRNQASPLIANNTVSANYWAGGLTCIEQSGPVITNNIVWDNESYEMYVTGFNPPEVVFNNIMGGWEGEGNIDADPMFVDSEIGNFNLQPNSPCIDAGDPEAPLDPDSTRADMGAFPSDIRADIETGTLFSEENGLLQNYPNPFNGSTSIKFTLEKRSYVVIEIFDMLGRLVSALAAGYHPAGDYQLAWKAMDYPSGIYICRLQIEGYCETRKMILVK